MAKNVTLYETEDGAVNRRVEQDLGGGQRVVVSDSQLAPDVEEFLEREPEATVVRERDSTSISNPERYTLENLPTFLATIDSADVLLDMMNRDSRVTADSIYLERLDEIIRDAAGDADEGLPESPVEGGLVELDEE